MATRHVGDIDTFEPRSGSSDTDAAAIPTPWRWFAFVWLDWENVAGRSPALCTQCQGEVISLTVLVVFHWE